MGSRKLNVPNKSLRYLHYSPHIILGTKANEMKWGGGNKLGTMDCSRKKKK